MALLRRKKKPGRAPDGSMSLMEHLFELRKRLSWAAAFIVLGAIIGGVLYTGVTADLAARIVQHRSGTGSRFAKRFNCTRLVWAEPHADIVEAIAREKAIKAWDRLWKLELIQAANPEWNDLFDSING